MLSQNENEEINSRKRKLENSVCAECNELEFGTTDLSNENFYCVYCWKEFYGEDIGIDDVKKMKKEVLHVAPKRKHHKFWEMPGEEKIVRETRETSKRKQKVPEADLDLPYYWFDKSSELLDLVNSVWDRDECGFILPIIIDFLLNEYVSVEVDAFADLGVRWTIREQISDHTGVIDEGVGLPVVRGYYPKSLALQWGISVGFELVSIDRMPLQRNLFKSGDSMIGPTEIKLQISEQMKKHSIFSGRKTVSLCFRRTIPVPTDNEEYCVKKTRSSRSKFWKYESVADKYTYGSYYAVNSETYQYWEPNSTCYLRARDEHTHTVHKFDSFDSSTIEYMTQERGIIKWRSTYRYAQNDGLHRTGVRYIPISFPCHNDLHWGVTIELGEEIKHWYVTTVTPDTHPSSIWREMGVLAGWQLKEIDGTKLTYENRPFFRELLMEGRACTILFKAYVKETSPFW